MKLECLPSSIRVKLDEEGEKELWQKVDGRGGVKRFCRDTGFSASDVYNWKNKDVFYPVDFVVELLGEGSESFVTAFKGGGRSLPVRNPRFPLDIGDELLTRIDCSVSVNREGVPVYRSQELSLIERFRELLSGIGDVPVSVYSRSGYELRYPKYLHKVFQAIDYEVDFAVLVDERGEIENGKVRVGGRAIPVEEFQGDLYSREKRFRLALERGDSGEVSRILGEERGKVRDALL